MTKLWRAGISTIIDGCITRAPEKGTVIKMARVGIIGFAHGHVFAFGDRWQKQPELDASIVCGWDHDGQRGEEGCAKLGARYVSDINAMLRDESIDSVVISCETSLHADYVEMAAAARKRIICYKPVALTLRQADRIVEAVDKYGVPFSMGWQMRADRQNIKIKELLDSGAFGKIYTIRRRHGLATQKMANFENLWHASPEYNRDIFADDAAHPMDFIYWLMGMPETVTAEFATMENPKIPNDNGIALLRYAGGAIAEVSCNFVCLAAENTVEVYCEKGTILLSYGDVPSTAVPHDLNGLKWILDGDRDWTYSNIPSPVSHGERIAGQAEALAGFLNGRRAPVATAQEARDALILVLACYVSNREGRRVAVDELDKIYLV